MEIVVHKPDSQELETQGVKSWPIWEKEVSKFDWHYDDTEVCYLLEGRVEVETDEGKLISFGKGDFVTFPKGLSCKWDIQEPVRKHYCFR